MGLHWRNVGNAAITSAVITHRAALNLTDWTIETCLRIDYPIAAGYACAILNKGDGSGNDDGPYYLLYEQTGGGTYQLRAGYWDGAAAQEATLAIELTLGLWYSVAAVHDDAAGTIDLYCALRQRAQDDARISTYGTSTQTTGLTGSPAGNSQPVYLGSSFVTAGAGFSTSDTRLWSSARSSAQLDAAVATRLVGDESGLLAYWPLDDGPGGATDGIAYDRAGTSTASSDATLRNLPDWTDDPIDLYYPHGSYLGSNSGILCWPSWTMSMGVSITASCASASGYPLTNLQNGKQALQWRNDGTLSYNLVFDFGVPRRVVAMTVENYRGTSASEITVELHSADSWGSPSVSETVQFGSKKLRHIFDLPGEYRYARLVIVDAGAEDSVHGMGCVHWWDAIEMVVPPDMDSEVYSQVDPSTTVELPHHHRVPRVLATSRDAEFTLKDYRRGWALRMRDVIQRGGSYQPAWFCSDVARRLRVGDVYGFLKTLPSESLVGPFREFQNVGPVGIEADRP